MLRMKAWRHRNEKDPEGGELPGTSSQSKKNRLITRLASCLACYSSYSSFVRALANLSHS